MQLTSDEIALAHDVKFDEEVCLLVKSHANKKLERLQETTESGDQQPGPGISVAVKNGEEAEQVINALRDPLSKRGYRAFWSERHEPNGAKETDEVAILKTDDPYAMIKVCKSDGANEDVFTDDIIERLEQWKNDCEFEVVGASRDWVALQFSRLPKDLLRFAEDVYLFCPDAIIQGVGFQYGKDKVRIAEARKLCPEPLSERIRDDIAKKTSRLGEMAKMIPPSMIPPGLMSNGGQALSNEVDTGIRLLAYEIHLTNALFLWWD